MHLRLQARKRSRELESKGISAWREEPVYPGAAVIGFACCWRLAATGLRAAGASAAGIDGDDLGVVSPAEWAVSRRLVIAETTELGTDSRGCSSR